MANPPSLGLGTQVKGEASHALVHTAVSLSLPPKPKLLSSLQRDLQSTSLTPRLAAFQTGSPGSSPPPSPPPRPPPWHLPPHGGTPQPLLPPLPTSCARTPWVTPVPSWQHLQAPGGLHPPCLPPPGANPLASPPAWESCKLNVALSLPSPPRSAEEQRSPRGKGMEGATRVEVRTGAQG